MQHIAVADLSQVELGNDSRLSRTQCFQQSLIQAAGVDLLLPPTADI